MNRVGRWALAVLIAMLSVVASASARTFGQLDRTFGTHGVVFDFPPDTSRDAGADSMVRQPDGKIVVAGFDFPGFLAERYLPNGHPDLHFGSAGITRVDAGGSSSGVPTYAQSVALAPDGKIVLGGQGPNAAHTGITQTLVRLRANGTPDPSFGSHGVVHSGLDGAASGVAVLSNGKILTVGENGPDAQIARFTSSGHLDSGFGHGGSRVFDFAPGGTVSAAKALVVRRDGEIVVTGGWDQDALHGEVGVALLTRSGALDGRFGTHGAAVFQVGQGPISTFTPTSSASSVALGPHGRIVVGGIASSSGALPSGQMALRLTSTGHLDSHFGTGGVTIVPNTSVNNASSMTLQHSGRVVLVGTAPFSSGTGQAGTIARLTTSGHLDPSFGSGGLVTDQETGGTSPMTDFEAALVQPDSKIVVAGIVNVPGGGESGRVIVERRIADTRPHVSLSGPRHTTAHHRVRFRATVTRSGTTIVKVRWRFGDGRTARGLRVRHRFAVAGHYRVRVTVTDAEGLKATATRTVHVT